MTQRLPRKRFGQNFLHDPNIINKIVDNMSPSEADHFVEIGPGQGAITEPLSRLAGKLDVIEIDKDLASDLAKLPWAEGIDIHCTDALAFAFDSITQTSGSLRLAGNLPYNISTPLLFHILSYRELFSDVHVMLQKEVVDRMTAQPGTKQYGRLTVALAAQCQVESLFGIRPGSFRPAPKVDSAFARLTPLPEPLVAPDEIDSFDQILRNAFGKRRKQLQNALRDLLSAEQIAAAGVAPEARAEQLTVEQFAGLARSLKLSP